MPRAEAKYRITAEDKASRTLKQLKGNLGEVHKGFDLIKGALGPLIAAGGAATFGAMVKSSIDAANRLGDLSTRLGVAVEDLSRLQYAAKLTGVSSTTLTTGLQRMTRRIAEAAGGSGEAVKALNELGLSAGKLKDLTPDQQFEVLADALESVPSQADKVRLSMKLLDSEGVALLQTMAGGSAAIRAMGEESDATGNTISTNFAASATKANAAINKLGAAATGTRNAIAAGMAPALESIADFLSENTPNAVNVTLEALNLMRRGFVTIAAELTGFIEGVTGTLSAIAYYTGNDELERKMFVQAQSFKETAKNLRDLELVYATTSDASNELNATVSSNVVNLADFQGETIAATAALKDEAAATRELVAARKLRQEQALLEVQPSSDLTKTVDDIRGSLADFEQDQQSPLEREQEQYAQRIEALRTYLAQNPELHRQTNDLIEAEEARHADAMAKIKEQENKATLNAIDGGLSLAASLMNSKSRKLFQIGKAAAISRALVSAAESIPHAYKWGASIGGPVLGAVFAGLAAAQTATQIQQIKSQQFGGGGTVSPGGSASAPNTYQPPQPTVPLNSVSSENVNSGTTIIINGDVNGNNAELILEELNELIGERDFVFASTG